MTEKIPDNDDWGRPGVHVPFSQVAEDFRVRQFVRPEEDITKPVSVREFMDGLIGILSGVLEDPPDVLHGMDPTGWTYMCDAEDPVDEEKPIRLSLRKEDGDGVLIVPLFRLPPSVLCPPRERETTEVAYFRIMWVFRLARESAHFSDYKYGRADRLLATDVHDLGAQVSFLLARCSWYALQLGCCYWLERHHAWGIRTGTRINTRLMAIGVPGRHTN